MSDIRLAELEERKKRLEEIKKRRATNTINNNSGNNSNNSASALSDNKQSAVDDILKNVTDIINKPVDRIPEIEERKETVSKNILSCSSNETFEIVPSQPLLYDRDMQTDEIDIKSPILSPITVTVPTTNIKHRGSSLSYAFNLISPTNASSPPVVTAKPALTEEQRAEILSSDLYKNFMSKATNRMEKVLYSLNGTDPFIDYTEDDNTQQSTQSKINLNIILSDDRVKNRPITSLNWSSKFDELLLTSYGERTERLNANEPDGIIFVWNLLMPNRPEFYFNSLSPILNSIFHPSNPNLIVASTYSGQLLLFDTRDKHTPVNRTSLIQGHTHPVYSVVFPTSNTKSQSTLFSVSTDGKLCAWNGDVLVDPLSELDLKEEKEEVTSTLLSLLIRESTCALVGSDEGKLFKTRLYDNPGVAESFRAHDAPITCIDVHPLKDSPGSQSDLFLTSACDWMVKLWSSKNAKPIYSFDYSRDYVYDVKWCPTRPSVFASVNAAGLVDIWDLNHDTEVPRCSEKIPEFDKRLPAVSKCKWSRNGKQLAVGDTCGRVILYDVSSELHETSGVDTLKFYEKMSKSAIDDHIKK